VWLQGDEGGGEVHNFRPAAVVVVCFRAMRVGWMGWYRDDDVALLALAMLPSKT